MSKTSSFKIRLKGSHGEAEAEYNNTYGSMTPEAREKITTQAIRAYDVLKNEKAEGEK